MVVRIVPPDPAWPVMFADEAQRLRAALHEFDVDVQHIGSTAIRDIAAKPVIDILLVVGDLDLLDAHAGRLGALGYEAKGEFGIPARRYFRRDCAQGIRTHQVHAFERGSVGAVRHLAFRDYMNAHPAAAHAYSALKQRLAGAFPNDMAAYIDGKSAFVQHHEALAVSWASNRFRDG
jgi:GrpB-like predicted nucleotidyltransferase (UPF0157 family)